jgi:hypothetical protein
MKAFGLFITGLVFTALFGAYHMGMLIDLIATLPEDTQLLLELWILNGKSVDGQFISLAAMLVGLFSIRIKKAEHQF